MSDWFPGAHQRPISRFSTPRRKPINAFILHVTVSPATSMYNYFSRANSSGCSSAHVAKDGTIEQYLSAAWRDAATVDARDRSFSAETQGAYPSSVANTEPWTDEQIESLAQLAAWLHTDHGLPLRLMESSQPDEAGIGWHRLGIDGNFPALPSSLAGRSQRGGGERWSTSRGKACPGDAKILQVPLILAHAKEIVGVDATPSIPVVDVTPKPTTPTTPTAPTRRYAMDKLDLRNADRLIVTGRHVNNLQGLLLAAGYGPDGLVDPKTGRPDGRAGSKTKRWFGRFQVDNPATGTDGKPDYVCGDKSWTALIER